MKNWIRIFLVSFVLIGGTAFFAYILLNQFNSALDNLSASSFAIEKLSPNSDKTNKEQIPTSTPEIISTSTSTSILTSTTSTDLKDSTSTTSLPFIFPKENNEVYIGCTYLLSFHSSTTIRSLETALIDADTIQAIEPIESGLARENKIKPDSQSVDWKVGVVRPGTYYLKMSNINGVDAKNYSKVFTISKMPGGISVDEREKLCKEFGPFIVPITIQPSL